MDPKSSMSKSAVQETKKDHMFPSPQTPKASFVFPSTSMEKNVYPSTPPPFSSTSELGISHPVDSAAISTQPQVTNPPRTGKVIY